MDSTFPLPQDSTSLQDSTFPGQKMGVMHLTGMLFLKLEINIVGKTALSRNVYCCINMKLSNNDISIDLESPKFYSKPQISIVLQLYISQTVVKYMQLKNGLAQDLIFSENHEVCFISYDFKLSGT